MKSSRSLLVVVGCGMLVLALSGKPVKAEAGSLEEPSVAVSIRLSEEVQNQVLAAVKIKEAKFLRGSWINWFTNLHYSGETPALNRFLEDLSKCPETTIHISFYRPGRDAMWAADDSDWSVFHDGQSNKFDVRINLESKRVKLEELDLPEIAGNE